MNLLIGDLFLKAKIWNEHDRLEKIKLEIELLNKTGKDPFEITADLFDSMKELLYESIKEANPNILFSELLEKARKIVLFKESIVRYL